MVDLIQYLDTIIIHREGESYQDDNNDWVTSDGETIELKCRFVPNGAGNKITLTDGTDFTFAYQIAFPLGTDGLRLNDEFTYVQTGEKGIIKRFKKGQLHSLAWA